MTETRFGAIFRPLRAPCPFLERVLTSVRHWVVVGFAPAMLLFAVAGIALALWPKDGGAPLVGASDWKIEGRFFRVDPEAVSLFDVPRPADGRIDFWRSWSPETLGTVGTIRSAPFPPPRYVAVPFYGFPAEVPGNRIFLRCVSTGREREIATLRTNDRWAMAYLTIERTFCPGSIELVACNADPHVYVGVGTPLAIGAAAFYAHASFLPRLSVVLATWAILCSLIVVLGFPLAARWNRDPAAAGFVMLGAVGMILFTVFHFAPGLGRAAVWGLIGGSWCALMLIWRFDRPWLTQVVRRCGNGALVWLAVSIAYAAFASAADNGGGSWAVNGLFTPLRWSTDNQLPAAFAEALFSGAPRDKIVWGPWLASDRTPLLAALLLIPRAAIISPIAAQIGTDFILLAYQLSALTIMASWAGLIFFVTLPFGRRCAGTVVFLAFCTSFFLFNTVYVWPKLLGATYVLIAFVLLVRMREGQTAGPIDLSVIALCAALSYLSHASNAFALVPLAVLFSGTILRRPPAEIAIAGTAALLCAAPWLWWQTVVQPGGNALLRYALTNDLYSFQHRGEPLIGGMLAAYRDLGLAGWLGGKVRGFATVLGVTADWRSFGEVAQHSPADTLTGSWRVLDFFLPVRTLGIALLGLVVLGCRGLTRSPSGTAEKTARLAATTGLAGIALSLVCMLVYPITPTQPFGAILLCFVAGALTLAQDGAYLRISAILAAFSYFTIVWLAGPLVAALRVETSALLALLLGVAAVVCITSVSTERHTNRLGERRRRRIS
jgi:hypothetical protein